MTAGANRASGHRNADRVNHRQAQIGDSGSVTRLVAGESTTLQGAQVRGEQIPVANPPHCVWLACKIARIMTVSNRA